MLSNGIPFETSDEVRGDRESALVACAKPFLKWAGGKRQIEEAVLYHIERMHPDTIEEYREPFLGGGAIFFALARQGRFKRAILSDTNVELITTYKAIRDDVEGVISALQRLCRRKYGPETYYRIRTQDPARLVSVSVAARMIYLNKTCYNGLYRVNKSGIFNVPFGKRKNPKIIDREGLRAASVALQGVELEVRDYESAYRMSVRGTFIYYDPPYVPVSRSSNFTSYQAGGFSQAAQWHLANTMRLIAESAVLVDGMALLSNSHCRKTLMLYQGLVRHRIAARRSINSDATQRGIVSELLVESRIRANKRK